jgi:IS5 family transposase
MATGLNVLALTLAVAVQPAAFDDAPTRIITESGVEIRLQEEVFHLFAALNAAGYAEESKRRAPPLQAPVFHPIRVEVRDALRELRDAPVTQAVRDLFESNPYPIEDYLAAMVAGEDDRLTGHPAQLAGKLGPLTAFSEEASLQQVFDRLAEDQRKLAIDLAKAIEADLTGAQERIADPDFRAPTELVIIPNPLDSHAAFRTLEVGKRRMVVVGPGLEVGRVQLIETIVTPYLRRAVNGAWGSASKYRTHWDGVKRSKRIARRYKTGKNYLTVALTRSLVHRLQHPGEPEADDQFVDEQAREGMRWARIALRVWDKHPSGAPFATELKQLVVKHGP